MAIDKAGMFDATTDDIILSTSETTIAHGLAYTPSEAFILRRTTGANVYRGTTAWDATNIYLIASAGTTVRLFIF